MTFAFLMVHITPGDPASLMLGPEHISPERLREIRENLGLEDPLWVQYYHWLQALVRGDLGFSYYQNKKVGPIIADGLLVTLPLVASAILFTILIGVPSGIVAAIRPNSLSDKLLAIVTVAGISFPHFWLGLVFIFFFGVKLRVLPVGGSASITNPLDFASHMVLPAFTLGFSQLAFLSRVTRSTMLDVLSEDYITTARAKGLAEQLVIIKHALKNASLPIITLIGLSIGILIGGTIVVETVFTIPGFGRSFLTSILRRDYPVIQGCTLVIGATYLLVNFIIDLLYVRLDPRASFD